MAAKAKVFIVDHARDADHKVFFVDRDSQQKNQQLVSPGEIVSHSRDAIEPYINEDKARHECPSCKIHHLVIPAKAGIQLNQTISA